jgi:hypothetical protein
MSARPVQITNNWSPSVLTYLSTAAPSVHQSMTPAIHEMGF